MMMVMPVSIADYHDGPGFRSRLRRQSIAKTKKGRDQDQEIFLHTLHVTVSL
jgi:hypothetical protein